MKKTFQTTIKPSESENSLKERGVSIQPCGVGHQEPEEVPFDP